ncbi:MAG: hypothetical protein BWY72_00551 [Bacteroidetes bacterium ADurb.Bin416]|nr:MAG: hypothetical protein BWY72_00551 [Bacteroidetes bacterium ADurb.Bin416]
MWGTRFSSWCIMAIPACWASATLANRIGWPSLFKVPSKSSYTPEKMFINVDLPAPFSPTKALTAPALTLKSTPSRASTPGKRLVTATASSNTVSDMSNQG